MHVKAVWSMIRLHLPTRNEACHMKTPEKLASILVVILPVSTSSLLAQKKAAANTTGKPAAKADTAKTDKPADKPADAIKSDKDKPKDPLENLRFRNLGPAVGGGRITAVAGIPGKPNVYY